MLVPQGITNFAIRLDSGDISYLSKQARKMLDEAGLTNCKIVASNALDEHLIRDLLMQGAKVDVFGVGERMITSKSAPVFGGVYKLVAIENENGEITPKIKLSENISKITNPHFKKYIVCMIKKLVKLSLMNFAYMMKQLIQQKNILFLIQMLHGNKKLSLISLLENCKFLSSKW